MSDVMKFFRWEDLPEKVQPVIKSVCEFADDMDERLPNCAEKSAGMRKLLEAKDCFVRAKME